MPSRPLSIAIWFLYGLDAQIRTKWNPPRGAHPCPGPELTHIQTSMCFMMWWIWALEYGLELRARKREVWKLSNNQRHKNTRMKILSEKLPTMSVRSKSVTLWKHPADTRWAYTNCSDLTLLFFERPKSSPCCYPPLLCNAVYPSMYGLW